MGFPRVRVWVFSIFFLPWIPAAGPLCCAAPDKIDSHLAALLAASPPETLIPVTISLAGGPSVAELRFSVQDLSGADRRLAARNLLRERSQAAQAGLLQRLAELRLSGAGRPPASLWITNAVALELTPALIRELAARPEVRLVRRTAGAPHFFGEGAFSGQAPLDSSALPECGVARVGAPEFWGAKGSRAEGVLIALLDSGGCPTHPDISRRIWVNPGEDLDQDGVLNDPDDQNGLDDDANGYADDFIGWDFADDDNNPANPATHGTNSAGILVGEGAGGRQTGVAPGARLMYLRVGSTSRGEVDAWLALQYAADNGAQVASLSFGWYHDDHPDRVTWREVLDNLAVMGLISFVAAGNNGGETPPGDIATPADVPSAIAVGNTSCSTEAIDPTSSQGPTTWETVHPYLDHPYPPGLLKPDLSAPGSGGLQSTGAFYSGSSCLGYQVFSGTSAAAPHAAGVAALLLGLKPDMSRDEMAHVLTTTAVDLGPPGPDRTYGHGRVSAMAASFALSGWVNYAGHLLDDALSGNGNLTVDPGEMITLTVTLHNSGAVHTARGVRAILTTPTAGVVIHDRVALYPDLAPGRSAISFSPHFTFTAGALCDSYITFNLQTQYSDGSSTPATFVVRVGRVIEEVIFEDNFETHRGWTRSGSSGDGFWVRENPHPAPAPGGETTQPEDDHSENGTKCYVTGNQYPISSAAQDDVDGGGNVGEVLTSPPFDSTGYETGTIEWWYWAFLEQYGGDKWIARLSNDDGASWLQLRAADAPGKRAWTRDRFPLSSLPPTPAMRLQFAVLDQSSDSLADGLLDDVRITGKRGICDPFLPPPALSPNRVGDSLRLSRQGEDIRLDWQTPPADDQHAPAMLYRVRKTGAGSAPFGEVGSATGTFFFDLGAAAEPETRFYLVTAENSGGEQPPD